uniref:Uncharacterized protein n=1 Tax=Setaria viridis TaxID=4556 RepID=A0A4U6VCY1_SETVI|nr:hypothetical protein SEVIR_3G248400v2 [Setaria viridis]
MWLGPTAGPSSFNQYWIWVKNIMPMFQQYHMVGLVAICWALWIARNKTCFEAKMIKSPTEIICSASSFISYWAGMQKAEDKANLEVGAEAEAALHIHPQEAMPEDTGTVLIQ